MSVAQRILIFGGSGLTFGTLMGILANGGNPNWEFIFSAYIVLIALVTLAHLRNRS